jgi:hypothetical protein
VPVQIASTPLPEPQEVPKDQPKGRAGTGSPVSTTGLAPTHANEEVPLDYPGPSAACTDAEAEDSDTDEVISEDMDDLRDSFLPPRATTVDALVHEMQLLFPSSRDPQLAARARSDVVAAYQAADLRCTVEAAIKDVGTFKFDETLLDRDIEDLKAADWSLNRMVSRRQDSRYPSSLNPDRVRAALLEDNPEWGKIMRFAEVGVEVSSLLPPDFAPTGNRREDWPSLRPGYVEAHHVVNFALVASFHASGLGIVLPTMALTALPEVCHIFTSNWAENKAKVRGRPTFNPKALNTKFSKLAADALWGRVRHSTVASIVRMILAFMAEARARGVHHAKLCLWKIDIRGAYTLLDNCFSDCRLFCSQLSGDKTFIYTSGCFWFAGQPAAFDVVTRAMKFELPRITQGDGDAYTDDFFGIAEDDDVDSDMDATVGLARTLTGPGADAPEKSKKSKQLEVIGWLLDLLLQLVTIGAAS